MSKKVLLAQRSVLLFVILAAISIAGNAVLIHAGHRARRAYIEDAMVSDKQNLRQIDEIIFLKAQIKDDERKLAESNADLEKAADEWVKSQIQLHDARSAAIECMVSRALTTDFAP